jgi:hypothetical protein
MADSAPHKAKGGRKNRKWDRSPKRSAKKREAYRKAKKREKNKVKRILQSSGITAASQYADKHELWDYLRKLLN